MGIISRPGLSTRLLVGVLIAAAGLIAACVPPEPVPVDPTLPTIPPPPPPSELVQLPVLSGFDQPTNVEFAPDGRVFVAERKGRLVTFDSIADTTPTLAADLRDPVRAIGDHGLLGLAVDPQWPARPFVYVMHTWDSTGLWGDGCAAGYSENGCVTGAKISRLTMGADGVMADEPSTIVDDRWCYQFSSHGVGDLDVLDDGTLLATSGEGAWFVGADYGQVGGKQLVPPIANLTPRNPCGDPPNGVGGPVDPVTSEGGAFRSQDVLTEGDPVGWGGSLIRIDPDTGLAPADNPLVGVGSPDDDHVLAHGGRNPFRFVVRPGTDEVYLADVGLVDHEEINRVVIGDGVARNFGWPCQEGPGQNRRYSALGNQMCDLARSADARTELTDPWFSYGHQGGASIAGIAVVPEGRYSPELAGHLLFADYVKGNTYALGIGADGAPDPTGPRVAVSGGVPVDLEASPDGYVYMVDYIAGSVLRLADRQSVPVARVQASATDGLLPLTVEFDATDSTGPLGDELTFDWDLDGDGQFDDATGPLTASTFSTATNTTVSVRVTDAAGNYSTASSTVYAGNLAPEVSIDVSSPLPWSANDDVTFAISATDPDEGVLARSSVSWEARLVHCYEPDDCHVHPYTGADGSTGSTITGPSHGYPSYLSLVATATDARGQTTTEVVDLDPAAVRVEVTSDPPGVTVTIGETTAVTPFALDAIRNDLLSVSVQSPQEVEGVAHLFSAWSTGAPQSHDFGVGPEDSALHLTMVPATP